MTHRAAHTIWSAADGLRYGLLGFPLAFCALPLYVLLPNWYARQSHVPLAALGAILLAVRLFDAVIDPMLGRLCDRLFAQSLRAVLCLGALAGVALGLGFGALFTPPQVETTALLAWVAAWLVVTQAAYSALTVAHQSWGAMLGGDAAYRSSVVAWREGLGLAGVLMAAVTPTLLGVPAMLALLAAGLLAGWLCWCQAPKPVTAHGLAPSAMHRSHVSIWHPWRRAVFRRLMTVYVLNGIASAIPATLVLFFVQDQLQAPETMQSAALGVYFVCGALSMPLWLQVVRRWGLSISWRLGMVLSIAAFIGASQLGAGDAQWFLLVCALSGAALGSDLVLPGALLAGVIAMAGDHGQAEGAYFGWWNFATKLNLALAAGLALPLLGWFGYTPGHHDPHTASLLIAAYCLLPCALKALATVALQVLIIQPAAAPHEP